MANIWMVGKDGTRVEVGEDHVASYMKEGWARVGNATGHVSASSAENKGDPLCHMVRGDDRVMCEISQIGPMAAAGFSLTPESKSSARFSAEYAKHSVSFAAELKAKADAKSKDEAEAKSKAEAEAEAKSKADADKSSGKK